MNLHNLKSKWNALMQEFPQTVKVFLRSALLIFVIWKLAYVFLLSEKRILDRPLTNAVARQTVFVLNGLSYKGPYHFMEYSAKTVDADGVSLEAAGSRVMYKQWGLVGIGDACNGLELLVLYVGFILAMPVAWKRKMLFTVGGLLGIHLINVFRCAGLAYWNMHWTSSFDFAHHYLFKAFVYGAIFLLWTWYSRNLRLGDAPQSVNG